MSEHPLCPAHAARLSAGATLLLVPVADNRYSITAPDFDGDPRWDEAWPDDGPSPAGNPGPYLHLPVNDIVVRIYSEIQPGDILVPDGGAGLGELEPQDDIVGAMKARRRWRVKGVRCERHGDEWAWAVEVEPS